MNMLEKVNVMDAVNAVKGLYQYDKIGRFNGNVISVVQVENRTLDFHAHEQSDELFMVLEGDFTLETEDGLIPLRAGEFVIVPKGTRHRPVATTLAKMLMVELSGTLNKSNSGDQYED